MPPPTHVTVSLHHPPTPLPRNLILTCDINSLMFVFDANDKRLSRCDTGISAYLTAPAYVPSDSSSPIQPYKHSQR